MNVMIVSAFENLPKVIGILFHVRLIQVPKLKLFIDSAASMTFRAAPRLH